MTSKRFDAEFVAAHQAQHGRTKQDSGLGAELLKTPAPARKAKYGSIKTEGYDSIKEFNRSRELKLLEHAGKISHLREKIVYVLIPVQKRNGMVAERECTYEADFVYNEAPDNREIVEDVKSEATRKKESYVIKRKLMLFVHGIRVRET